MEFVSVSKWGCDGSAGQSEYKQKFDDNSHSDTNIFLTVVLAQAPKTPRNR